MDSAVVLILFTYSFTHSLPRSLQMQMILACNETRAIVVFVHAKINKSIVGFCYECFEKCLRVFVYQKKSILIFETP